MQSDTQLLISVSEFLWYEADLLDHKSYQEWLQLWTKTGFYIVPAELDETDYLNSVNLAMDDDEMRQLRVKRLENGESVSAASVSGTIRMISRIRIVESSDDQVKVRLAMTLNEMRHGVLVTYPAEVEYTLNRSADGFKIEQKVVKLLHTESYLRTVSFIF
ncbi:hypothetical protein EH243_16900 [Amphritea opalescens]|uniref:Aromatic-ring-hydroxylating dioxygenase subunit beta n=1 Tax=Amphritea opalescens TaxID=2490544 RepID=A0A430KLZ1_9GAMM|nr:aromatic-ring-hydroxylating dioxygenase subunit beta [Amphritea opalescens]RTE64499.1 hypothetical protein EH243_16900 [Amphritea opalescens]